MTGPTHLIIAAAATIALSQNTGHSPPGFTSWLALLAASLVPDIDEPKSTVSNPASIFNKLMPRWVQRFINTPFQAASSSIRSLFGHRGATHYLIWPFIMGWLAWYNSNVVLAWFAWGYLCHELSDWITRMGIPAAGPFYRKNFSILPKPMRLKTGGRVEDAINTACWLYLLYAIYVYY